MVDVVGKLKQELNMQTVLEHYGFILNRNGSVLCPFHNDTNPSMKVFRDRYYCFSCNAHGDIIDFVQEYFGLNFIGAIQKLGNDFGISVDEKSSPIDDIIEKQNVVDRRAIQAGSVEFKKWLKLIEDRYIEEHYKLFRSGKNEKRRLMIERFLNDGETRILYGLDKERKFEAVLPPEEVYIYHGDAVWNTEKGYYKPKLPKQTPKKHRLHSNYWQIPSPEKNYMDELAECKINVDEDSFFFRDGESFEQYSARCNMPMPF